MSLVPPKPVRSQFKPHLALRFFGVVTWESGRDLAVVVLYCTLLAHVDVEVVHEKKNDTHEKKREKWQPLSQSQLAFSMDH